MLNSNGISEALGIEYDSTKIKLPVKKEDNLPTMIENNQEEDFNLVRETLRNLVKTGGNALEELEEIARVSEQPKAYEVIANLIRTIADNGHALIDLHMKSKVLQTQGGKVPSVNVDKGIIFQGSSADLLTKIKNGEIRNREAISFETEQSEVSNKDNM